jgi:phosphoglycerol transferase MdoB-like AlkP superfamily enzyme
MKLWMDLLTTDYGLLSLAVIVFILVMAVWYWRFFSSKMALPPDTP